MANILYVDASYRSSELIECLDDNGVDYEIHSAAEARANGYKSLPLLIVDGKELDYKKAKRYAKGSE